MRESTKGVLSMKNPYYIPKYRYYELKYRCLQYNLWTEAYNDLTNYLYSYDLGKDKVDGGGTPEPVYLCTIERLKYRIKMDEVKQALSCIPMDLQNVIFEAVTEGKGWQVLQAKYELYCTREEYYYAYHWFFWEYDKIRN